MTILNRDDILNIEDRSTTEVDVPEWGGKVLIRVMSGFDRDKLELSFLGKNGGQNATNVRAKYAAYSIVDDKGNNLFSESDIVKLGKKSARALDRVYMAILDFNKIGDDDIVEEAKN